MQARPPARRLWLRLTVLFALVGGVLLRWQPPSMGQAADARTQRVAEAGDVLVWCILALLAFIGSLLGLWAWAAARRAQRPDPAREFADEMYHKLRQNHQPEEAEEPGWERPADWWKGPERG
jgi:protein-S-isoprenylcysteine O-methyltransferase Ste14